MNILITYHSNSGKYKSSFIHEGLKILRVFTLRKYWEYLGNQWFSEQGIKLRIKNRSFNGFESKRNSKTLTTFS